MIMSLNDIRLQQSDRFNKLRIIKRLVESIEFEEIFPYFNEQEKIIINDFISKLDDYNLRNMIKKKIRERCNLEELPMVILRNKACELSIKGWQYLTKAQLLSRLSNVRSNHNSV